MSGYQLNNNAQGKDICGSADSREPIHVDEGSACISVPLILYRSCEDSSTYTCGKSEDWLEFDQPTIKTLHSCKAFVLLLLGLCAKLHMSEF